MDCLIKATDICKDFELGEVTVHALRHVSFEIDKKELIVILGPSGSGKSTLLNILGGIETATSGEIVYGGRPLDWRNQKAMTAYRRAHVGFVFQFYNLMPGLTALENVELAAELGENPLDPRTLMEQVGLSDRADHFPSKLSGGQQQRVAIARALCKNPDILLCDEPTGALDSQTGIQILKLLLDFNRKYQKAVVLITHNQNIARIADRVFFFKDGCLERIQVNERPLCPEEVDWR
ncbi:MAG: ABC transporter ATP-binding protein [Lachnospiraceae bacterium]|nr:ABC transporter ATP-binding protein [Lachnospiraceae bacterium]